MVQALVFKVDSGERKGDDCMFSLSTTQNRLQYSDVPFLKNLICFSFCACHLLSYTHFSVALFS